MRQLTMFLAGVLFSVGLAVAGMTQPQKVIGFLDFFGAWDPSLMFVMVGAIAVNLVLFRLTMRTKGPVYAPRFQVPTRRDLDARLIGGSALFGVGWGLAGFCPGPAIASLPAATPSVLVFVAAMVGGMALFHAVERMRQAAVSARREQATQS